MGRSSQFRTQTRGGETDCGSRLLTRQDQPVPPVQSLAAFAAVSFAIIIIPGPSVMFVVGRALSLGRRAALVTVAGNAAGFYVQVVLVALGLGAIVERSAAVFTTIKLIGALYLVWVGVQAIIHRRANAELSTAVDGAGAVSTHRSLFVDGFVVGVANPKTIVFFAAILPQFVQADGAPAGVQMLALGVIFAVIALASDSVWGLAAGTARTWFVRSPRRLEVVGAAGGVAIVGLGVRLALTRRSD
jgi:threonine/homoserine/homoserine lactone efflux protein